MSNGIDVVAPGAAPKGAAMTLARSAAMIRERMGIFLFGGYRLLMSTLPGGMRTSSSVMLAVSLI
jgi:hypothetical protein